MLPAPFDVPADRPAWLSLLVTGILILGIALGGVAMAVAGIMDGDATDAGLGALVALLAAAILAGLPFIARSTVTRLCWDGTWLHVAWASGRRASVSPHDFVELDVRPLPHGCRAVRVRCRDGQVVGISDAGKAMGVRDARAVAALLALASHAPRRGEAA